MQKRQKLLLHVCCCSCAVYVYQKLSADYDVTCFFYNPNIHPASEYESRKKELERIAQMNHWDVVYADYNIKGTASPPYKGTGIDKNHRDEEKACPRDKRLQGNIKEWFRRVKGHEKDPERGERCSICFNMRLEKAFEYAKTNGFDVVASTLSISPYKVTRQINAEGEALSRTFGIQFLPENFKKQDGYNIGKKMAMALGIKHQNYCGCVYSKVERKKKSRGAAPLLAVALL